MKASGACISLIKRMELCRLKTYRDPGGVLTNGWGNTGPDVYEGQVISQETADWRLGVNVAKAEAAVNDLTDGLTLTQGQFDALVDFTFNLGKEALRFSTLLRKLKAGDVAGAAGQFERWVYEKKDGKEIEAAALLARRKEERRMFLGN